MKTLYPKKKKKKGSSKLLVSKYLTLSYGLQRKKLLEGFL